MQQVEWAAWSKANKRKTSKGKGGINISKQAGLEGDAGQFNIHIDWAGLHEEVFTFKESKQRKSRFIIHQQSEWKANWFINLQANWAAGLSDDW